MYKEKKEGKKRTVAAGAFTFRILKNQPRLLLSRDIVVNVESSRLNHVVLYYGCRMKRHVFHIYGFDEPSGHLVDDRIQEILFNDMKIFTFAR